MKKLLCVSAILIAFVGQSALAATVELFCPESWNDAGIDGNGILKVWGVPELSGYPLLAGPNETWPRFMAVAAWRDAIVDAKKDGTCIKIHYDPTLFQETASGVWGYRIWEVIE